MDTTALGQTAALVMEKLEEGFKDEAATITQAVIVVAIDTGEPNAEIIVGGTPKLWIQKALLYEGIDSVEDHIRELTTEPEE